jgi:hypothetical protein
MVGYIGLRRGSPTKLTSEGCDGVGQAGVLGRPFVERAAASDANTPLISEAPLSRTCFVVFIVRFMNFRTQG